jgi:hypothetical protein
MIALGFAVSTLCFALAVMARSNLRNQHAAARLAVSNNALIAALERRADAFEKLAAARATAMASLSAQVGAYMGEMVALRRLADERAKMIEALKNAPCQLDHD